MKHVELHTKEAHPGLERLAARREVSVFWGLPTGIKNRRAADATGP